MDPDTMLWAQQSHQQLFHYVQYILPLGCALLCSNIQQMYMMQIVHCCVANISNQSADFHLCTLSFRYALARKHFVKEDFKASHIL